MDRLSLLSGVKLTRTSNALTASAIQRMRTRASQFALLPLSKLPRHEGFSFLRSYRLQHPFILIGRVCSNTLIDLSNYNRIMLGRHSPSLTQALTYLFSFGKSFRACVLASNVLTLGTRVRFAPNSHFLLGFRVVCSAIGP